jgi:hypothetical protein
MRCGRSGGPRRPTPRALCSRPASRWAHRRAGGTHGYSATTGGSVRSMSELRSATSPATRTMSPGHRFSPSTTTSSRSPPTCDSSRSCLTFPTGHHCARDRTRAVQRVRHPLTALSTQRRLPRRHWHRRQPGTRPVGGRHAAAKSLDRWRIRPGAHSRNDTRQLRGPEMAGRRDLKRDKPRSTHAGRLGCGPGQGRGAPRRSAPPGDARTAWGGRR